MELVNNIDSSEDDAEDFSVFEKYMQGAFKTKRVWVWLHPFDNFSEVEFKRRFFLGKGTVFDFE